MERRYQGYWDENMLADYCWSVNRDCEKNHKRKSNKSSFEGGKKQQKKNKKELLREKLADSL